MDELAVCCSNLKQKIKGFILLLQRTVTLGGGQPSSPLPETDYLDLMLVWASQSRRSFGLICLSKISEEHTLIKVPTRTTPCA